MVPHDKREQNIRNKGFRRTRLSNAVEDDFVHLRMRHCAGDRISMERAAQHPVFLSLEDRLTYLTRVYHNNKALLQQERATNWNQAVEDDLWNAFTFSFQT
jgi:hypothetical protein